MIDILEFVCLWYVCSVIIGLIIGAMLRWCEEGKL